MIEVMNAMKFDLVAFGNHEFDLKEQELQQRLNESTFQWIATNPIHKFINNTLEPFSVVKYGLTNEIPKTVTFNIENEIGKVVKIGFFSDTINSNPKDYVDYGDFYESAKYAYNNLKLTTDVVFGLTHLTIEQDKIIANMFPNTPLIMGGHEHVNMSVPVGKSKIYKVAFSDYLLKGFDIPFLTPENKGVIKVPQNEVTSVAYDIRKAIILYLESL